MRSSLTGSTVASRSLRTLARRAAPRSLETGFGVADAYAAGLREHGHAAVVIHAKNLHVQRAWAVKHGLPAPSVRAARRVLLEGSTSFAGGASSAPQRP
jgi:hypothetical protein